VQLTVRVIVSGLIAFVLWTSAYLLVVSLQSLPLLPVYIAEGERWRLALTGIWLGGVLIGTVIVLRLWAARRQPSK
jgi:hypothetical protein